MRDAGSDRRFTLFVEREITGIHRRHRRDPRLAQAGIGYIHSEKRYSPTIRFIVSMGSQVIVSNLYENS